MTSYYSLEKRNLGAIIIKSIIYRKIKVSLQYSILSHFQLKLDALVTFWINIFDVYIKVKKSPFVSENSCYCLV